MHRQPINKIHPMTVILSNGIKIGDPVWLSSPTAGKLDLKWEGGWEIQSVQGSSTYTITDGTRTRTVHVNQLRPRTQLTSSHSSTPRGNHWAAPSIEDDVIDTGLDVPGERHYIEDLQRDLLSSLGTSYS